MAGKVTRQADEKQSSAALPSSFVIAAYIRVRLISQDCLPEWQVKRAAAALHLGIFDQPGKRFF